MPDSAKHLLVPIQVQALVVDDAVIDQFGTITDAQTGKRSLGSGRWLPAGAEYGNVAGRLAALGPDLFLGMENDNYRSPGDADRGVYLHWVLPGQMRHAHQQADGSLRFPPLPDQWLVVRLTRRTSQQDAVRVDAWYVDSGLLETDGQAATAQMLLPDEGSKRFAAQRVGKTFTLLAADGQAPSRFPALDATDLSQYRRASAPITGAANRHTGSPTFTASVADNRNILSWHDDLADLRAQEQIPDDMVLSYQVLGWYRSDAATDEPLAFTLANLSDVDKKQGEAAAVLRALGWQLGAAASASKADKPDAKPSGPAKLPSDLLNWHSVFHGMVAYINYWQSDEHQGYQGPLLGYPGAPYIHDGTAPDRPLIKVGMGNCAADALVALVGGDDLEAADPSDDRAELWKLLEAMVYRHLPTLQQNWQETQREFSVHQNWFSPQAAGYRWILVSKERDQDTLAVPVGKGKDPVRHPQPTTEQLADLRALNEKQALVNQRARKLAALQQDLYARWWSLCRHLLVSGGAGGGSGGDPLGGDPFGADAGDGSGSGSDGDPFGGDSFGGNGGNGSSTAHQADNLKAFADAVKTGWDDLSAALSDLHVANQALQGLLLDSGLELRYQAEPRFWQPADPYIVIQNLGNQDKHFSPQAVICRPQGQPVSQISVSVPGTGGESRVWKAPAGMEGLKAKLQQLPQAPSALAELLDEASLLEQALADLVQRSRQEEPDWTNWLARVLADMAWDGSADDAPADLVHLAGQEEDGTLLSRLVSLWGKQPWSPLYLDWQITYHPSASLEDGFGSDWTRAEHDYVPAGSNQAAGASYTLQGRSLMAPVSGHFFTDPIDDVLKVLQDPAGQSSVPWSDAMKEALLANASRWRSSLDALKDGGLLGQALSGFHQAMLRRHLRAPRVWPDADYPWVQAGQSPYDDGSLLQGRTLESPNALPRALVPSGQDRADHPLSMPTLAPFSEENTEANNLFGLVRAGSFTVDRLWMVDDFGQWVDLAGNGELSTGVVLSPHSISPDGGFALPPRILQPARLDLRFSSPDDPGEASDHHPDTNPICGWVFHNYQDQALVLCDRQGQVLGELILVEGGADRHATRWTCLVPGQAPQSTLRALNADATLVAFAEALIDPTPRPRQPLQDLMQLIDRSLATMRPSGGDNRFRLAGRPLALVSARAGLELFGQAWQDPDPDKQTRPPEAAGGTGDAALDSLSLPLQLGYAPLARDGLVGYYNRSDGGGMNRIIPASQANTDGLQTGYVSQDPTADQVRVGFGDPKPVTLLMEPHGSVHASVGILPAKTLTLPAFYLDQAREKMELSLRVAPVMLRRLAGKQGGSDQRAELPVPLGLRGQWRFHSDLPGFQDVGVIQPSSKPDYSGALPLAVEGRLVLKNVEREQK